MVIVVEMVVVMEVEVIVVGHGIGWSSRRLVIMSVGHCGGVSMEVMMVIVEVAVMEVVDVVLKVVVHGSLENRNERKP